MRIGFGGIWLHGAWQLLSLVCLVVGFGLGVHLAKLTSLVSLISSRGFSGISGRWLGGYRGHRRFSKRGDGWNEFRDPFALSASCGFVFSFYSISP